jgi:hypothetical protein
MKRVGLAFGWSAVRGYEPIRQEYDSVPVRPVVDSESHWEDVPRDAETVGEDRWDHIDVRNSAYQSVFAGAAGHSYGHVSVYAFFTPGGNEPGGFVKKFARTPWKDALDAPGAREIGHIKALMLSRPYFTRIPDQGIILGDTGTGSAHVSATRDREGKYFMVYLPEGQPVRLDMTKLAGLAANAWWFDPRTGKATRIEGSFPTNQALTFTPSSRGRGNDWVLVIDNAAERFAEPGQISKR